MNGQRFDKGLGGKRKSKRRGKRPVARGGRHGVQNVRPTQLAVEKSGTGPRGDLLGKTGNK